MNIIKYSIVAISVLLLAACGSGDSYHDYDEAEYIYWTGSVNGTIVIDATDDPFEFEVDSGYLHFGNTTYTNAWVDDYANFWVDGQIIGGVYYIEDIDGYTITGLISNNGHYIDIYGPESDLAWEETNDLPIYALNSSRVNTRTLGQEFTQRLAQEPKGTVEGRRVAPKMIPNAVTEERPTGSTGTLGKKQPVK